MDYCVLDFETTSLDTSSCKLIEVACVRVRDDNIISSFTELINPEKDIPSIITSITGITNEDVKDKRVISEVLPELLEFINTDIIIAHNADFEKGILLRLIKENNLEFKNNAFICTLMLGSNLVNTSKDLKSMCEFFNIKINKQHRALDDVESTYKLYQAIKSKLNSINPNINAKLNSIANKLSKLNIKK